MIFKHFNTEDLYCTYLTRNIFITSDNFEINNYNYDLSLLYFQRIIAKLIITIIYEIIGYMINAALSNHRRLFASISEIIASKLFRGSKLGVLLFKHQNE